MERPIRPAFLVELSSIHFKNNLLKTYVLVPDGVYPMDLYNALLQSDNLRVVEPVYGWITSSGKLISSHEAAELAFEHMLIDTRIETLSTEDYQGNWRRKAL